MRKLRNLVRSLLLIGTILVGSLAIAGRIDFGIHETEFINGDCKLENKDFPREGVTLWTCEFTDGCLAGWMSDITGANQRNFRWIDYMRHGVMM